ncbi:hypothetical protein GCM10010451_13280 [Streptomyces virens]|uniref:Uncharacterized protein n=1 Tax=Streptomyces virens TaxID=285572 RepID=A0ABP6P3P4_9ACTN
MLCGRPGRGPVRAGPRDTGMINDRPWSPPRRAGGPSAAGPCTTAARARPQVTRVSSRLVRVLP